MEVISETLAKHERFTHPELISSTMGADAASNGIFRLTTYLRQIAGVGVRHSEGSPLGSLIYPQDLALFFIAIAAIESFYRVGVLAMRLTTGYSARSSCHT